MQVLLESLRREGQFNTLEEGSASWGKYQGAKNIYICNKSIIYYFLSQSFSRNEISLLSERTEEGSICGLLH